MTSRVKAVATAATAAVVNIVIKFDLLFMTGLFAINI